MGNKSHLTPQQWEDIGRRLLNGERASALAREYKINRSAITRKHGKSTATIKTVANQILAAEVALKALPVAQQIATTDLLNQLRSISSHLASAANYGAATAHRLSGIANSHVDRINDVDPLDDGGIKTLQGISALVKVANDSAVIGLNLLAANKGVVDNAQEKSAITIHGGFTGD
jgi:hypothetical protein